MTLDSLFSLIDLQFALDSANKAEQIGKLTKRKRATNYASEQITKLSADYNNRRATALFYKQGKRAEKINAQKCEPKCKKPFWQEYFEI